jgi:putative addiction module component (TIGR02574 family)
MTKTLQDIEEDIQRLSTGERATLVQHLISTLDDEDDEDDEDVEEIWLKEAERRYDEYRQGKVAAVSADAAFESARCRVE